MAIRFDPASCPGCGEPLHPKYSTYRHGTRHWLFRVGLILGVFAILGLIACSFWVAFELTAVFFGEAGLQQRESGMLTFLIQLLMFALIVVGARIGWRALDRLPRTFTAGCQTCPWTGPCKVYENGAES